MRLTEPAKSAGELRPGDYVLLDGVTRVVKHLAPHPAGAAVFWIGGEMLPLKTIVDRGGKKMPQPLRNPQHLIEIAH